MERDEEERNVRVPDFTGTGSRGARSLGDRRAASVAASADRSRRDAAEERTFELNDVVTLFSDRGRRGRVTFVYLNHEYEVTWDTISAFVGIYLEDEIERANEN